jgi:hypothetical protein
MLPSKKMNVPRPYKIQRRDCVLTYLGMQLELMALESQTSFKVSTKYSNISQIFIYTYRTCILSHENDAKDLSPLYEAVGQYTAFLNGSTSPPIHSSLRSAYHFGSF